jgi:2-methylisocitrate lyase-like PEP mutase family enzyme
VLAVPGLSVAELADAGVKRISLGSKLTNAAFSAVRRAAREILDEGSFDFARQAMPFDELQALFAAAR